MRAIERYWSLGHWGRGAPAARAEVDSSRGGGAVWPAVAAFAAFLVAWCSADIAGVSRETFVLPYAMTAGVIAASFVRSERVNLGAELRRYPLRTLLATAVAGGLAIAGVLVQPGAPRAHGARLVFELVWDGVVYGAADGVLLTVVPMAAVRRALSRPRWTADALALFASIAVFTIYHLGFPEFRGGAIAAPIAASLIFGTVYLVSQNPLAPIGAHAAMHLIAVLQGPQGTVQLPPHY